MSWFVRFGQGASAEKRWFDSQADAAEYGRSMRAWYRAEGWTARRVIVGRGYPE